MHVKRESKKKLKKNKKKKKKKKSRKQPFFTKQNFFYYINNKLRDILSDHDYNILNNQRNFLDNSILVGLYDLPLKTKESMDKIVEIELAVLELYAKQFVVVHVGDNPVKVHKEFKIRNAMRMQKHNKLLAKNEELLCNFASHIGPLHCSLNFQGEILDKFLHLCEIVGRQIFHIKITSKSKPWTTRHVLFVLLAGWMVVRDEVLSQLTVSQRKYPEVATFIYICENLLPSSMFMYSYYYKAQDRENYMCCHYVFLIAVMIFRRKHYDKNIVSLLTQYHYWEKYAQEFDTSYWKHVNLADDYLAENFHSMLSRAMLNSVDNSAAAHQRAAVHFSSPTSRALFQHFATKDRRRYSDENIEAFSNSCGGLIRAMIANMIKDGDKSERRRKKKKEKKNTNKENASQPKTTYKTYEFKLPNLLGDEWHNCTHLAPAYSAFLYSKVEEKDKESTFPSQTQLCDWCGNNNENEVEALICGHALCKVSIKEGQCRRQTAADGKSKADCDICFGYLLERFTILADYLTSSRDGDMNESHVVEEEEIPHNMGSNEPLVEDKPESPMTLSAAELEKIISLSAKRISSRKKKSKKLIN